MVATRTRVGKGTEPEKELKSQLGEAKVELCGDRGDDESCACRMKAIEDTAYLGWRVNDGLEKFEEKKL